MNLAIVTLKLAISVIEKRIVELKELANNETKDNNLKCSYLIRLEEQQMTVITFNEVLIGMLKADMKEKNV